MCMEDMLRKAKSAPQTGRCHIQHPRASPFFQHGCAVQAKEANLKVVLKPLAEDRLWKIVVEPRKGDVRFLSRKIPILGLLNVQVCSPYAIAHRFSEASGRSGVEAAYGAKDGPCKPEALQHPRPCVNWPLIGRFRWAWAMTFERARLGGSGKLHPGLEEGGAFHRLGTRGLCTYALGWMHASGSMRTTSYQTCKGESPAKALTGTLTSSLLELVFQVGAYSWPILINSITRLMLSLSPFALPPRLLHRSDPLALESQSWA